jgi:O-antigen biosynthesis protein
MAEIERFVPGMAGTIWYEHWHRYQFALPFAAGLEVMDAACGEGYGSALLATRARRVRGVDASADAVALARRRYGAATNLEFLQGRCEALPVEDRSIDLLVSFETIEHLEAPRALIAEAARVLRPDGLFMVSTPNKALYTDETGYHNEYHLSEMYQDEFVAALRERFPAVALFGQRVDTFSAMWPLEDAPREVQLWAASARDPAAASEGLRHPVYLVALCAADPARVAAPRFSLLADSDRRSASPDAPPPGEIEELRAHSARIEAAYLDTQKRLALLQKERDRLATAAQPAAGPGWPRR